MKKFTSAVEEVVIEADTEARIEALTKQYMDEGMSPMDAKIKAETEGEAEDSFVEFELDGRTMRAYQPNEGQLVFLMATMGRGQNQQSRFASIINVMLESLRDDDKDYLEGRLLTRGPERLKVKKVEEIFEYLVEEWFATPTQSSSDSVSSPPSGGKN